MNCLEKNSFNKFENGLVNVQQNIRSFDLFTLKIQNLVKLPDIIILSETWIDDSELTL